MNTREVLIAARKLIEKPENWCIGSYGDSEMFCMRAAIAKAGKAHASDCVFMRPFYRLFENFYGASSIVDYNDSHTHAEVLALFDKAIVSLEQPAQLTGSEICKQFIRQAPVYEVS